MSGKVQKKAQTIKERRRGACTHLRCRTEDVYSLTRPFQKPANRVHTVRAYAKINLGLLVLEKRPDGYHDIETVFHTIALHDVVTIEPCDRIVVECSDRTVPTDRTNLAFRAALLLQRHCPGRKGVRITIHKEIPTGAGLGGGSADAAAVLRTLPGIWECHVDDQTMHETALRIGSDVPFFLRGGTAVGKGRGEMLEYFDLTVPHTILVCNPGIHVSTPDAYHMIRPHRRHCDFRTILAEGMSDPRTLNGQLVNDFEGPVFAVHPALRDLKESMLTGGAAFALMSGSGSSVYGLFDDEPRARATADSCAARGYSTFLTPPGFMPA